MKISTRMKAVSSVFTMVLIGVVWAQMTNWEWASRGGGENADEVHAVGVDADGNCYIAGYFVESAVFGDTLIESRGKSDVFLAKYDPDGKLSWIRCAGGKEEDKAYSLEVDDAGNALVTGIFSDTSYFSDDTLICFDTNPFYYDVFIAGYDADGELIMLERAGEQYWDEAFGISRDKEKNIFITGSYWGSIKFDHVTLSGLYGMGSIDGFDIFIAKYDPAGGILWANRLVEQGWDRGSAVVVDADGFCYITGGFQSGIRIGGYGGPLYTATGGGGDEDIFIVQYNPDGDLGWHTAAGSDGFDQARAVAVGPDKEVYITGLYSDTAYFEPDSVISAGLSDIFLARYDSLGNLDWVRGAGGPGDDGANDVVITPDGQIIICGYLGAPAIFGNIQSAGSGLFVAQYDPTGKTDWVKMIDEPDNLAAAVAAGSASNLALTGMFEGSASFGDHILTSEGATDIFVTYLDTSGLTGLSDRGAEPSLPDEIMLHQNYPNPFNPSTTIRFDLPAAADIKLRIFDINGRRILETSGSFGRGLHEVILDMSRFASGIYFYGIKSNLPDGSSSFSGLRKMVLIK